MFPFLLAATASAATASCPTVSTIGSAHFNLTEWVRKTWFIQEQQIVDYQPASSFHCVAATYNLEGAKVPLFGGTVVTVYNYANNDRVNGPLTNADNTTLCARALNKADTSKLAVAPCFLPNPLSGPYWVLSLGEDAASPGEYSWAVVIGGQPTVKWEDGCTTKESGTNNAGLWLLCAVAHASPRTRPCAPPAHALSLTRVRSCAPEHSTRNPVATKGQLEAMHKALKDQGVATSRLHPVAQEGCTYYDAVLK